MNVYLVVVKERFVRSEISDNNFIKDYYNQDIKPGSYEWYILNGELVVGAYHEEDAIDAIMEASKDLNINKDALRAYRLY